MKKVTNEPEIITRAGKAVSVILPLKDYQKLLDRLEERGRHRLFENGTQQTAFLPPLERIPR